MKFFRIRWALVFMALCVLCLGACARYRSLVLTSKVNAAARDFQSQRYESAIARYNYLITEHPMPEKKELFLFQKALSLYLLKSYHNSEKNFNEYLRLFPEGDYTSEAKSYLNKIEALRARREREYVLQREQIKDDVKLLQEMVERDPYNAQVHYDLANKYWELRRYEKATTHYLKAGEIDAAIKEKDLLKNRLMIDEDGKVVPLTPRRANALERESNPLVIFDTNSYKQRINPDVMGASKAFQTVAGKVRNQSTRVLRSVSISVNFYNVHYELLDTRSYHIGTMAPGEVRAFIVKGSNYDNIYNIDNFECVPYYQ